MRSIEHWINGSATAAGSTRTAPVYDPARGTQQATVLLAESTEVDNAVAAAAKAFQSWQNSSLNQRMRVMFAFRELLVRHEAELARLVSSEHGKVIDDARGEIVRGREVVEYACGVAEALKGGFSDQVSRDVDVHSLRQPLGVCAGITPFNFPVMVPCWMHPIAVATGNTFVLKPSERAPSAANLIARLYAEAGLPDGVFNVVHGDKVAVDAILEHPDIAAVSFVGPTLIDWVTPAMDVYTDEIFGPVLSVVRASTVDEALKLVNANPYGNGTAIFTSDGESARRFAREVTVGMVGVNVPIPVPVSCYSFGGWKDSLFGDSAIHGPEGVRFYTRAKVVTSRWPHVAHRAESHFNFPTPS